jgi:hypothetical protein
MQCSAKTRRGRQCQAPASRNGLCAMHAEPSRASEMGRKSGAARRYAYAGSACLMTIPETAAQIKTVLGQVILDLANRRLAPKAACAMAYVTGVTLRAIEASGWEERITKLEALVQKGRGQGDAYSGEGE